MEISVSITKQVDFRVTKVRVAMDVQFSVNFSEMVEHSWSTLLRVFAMEDDSRWTAERGFVLVVFLCNK